MIRSMTGFGEAERDTAAGRLRAEVRTVNHRFFSANLRLARPIERYEGQVREWLRSRLSRGHVNFSLRIERNGLAADAGLKVDVERARKYLEALRTLQSELGLSGEIDVRLLSRFGDLIVFDDDSEQLDVDIDEVRQVTEDAADATVRMREQEGHRLAADLEDRLIGIEVALTGIEEAAPGRLLAERDRMHRVVSELLEGQPLDPPGASHQLVVDVPAFAATPAQDQRAVAINLLDILRAGRLGKEKRRCGERGARRSRLHYVTP